MRTSKTPTHHFHVSGFSAHLNLVQFVSGLVAVRQDFGFRISRGLMPPLHAAHRLLSRVMSRIVTGFVTGFPQKNLGKMRLVTVSRVQGEGIYTPLSSSTVLTRHFLRRSPRDPQGCSLSSVSYGNLR